MSGYHNTENRIVKNYSRYKKIMEFPYLIEHQLDSFADLKQKGIEGVMSEVSPIVSKNGRFMIYLPTGDAVSKQAGLKYWIEAPKYTMNECMEFELIYGGNLFGHVLIVDTKTGESLTKTIDFGVVPEITPFGSYIINGRERIIITQLVKSPGAYYGVKETKDTGEKYPSVKIVPDKGAYIEIDALPDGSINVCYDRRFNNIPVTEFLKMLALLDDGTKRPPYTTGSNEELLDLFNKLTDGIAEEYLKISFDNEKHESPKAALIDLFKKINPQASPTQEAAQIRLGHSLHNLAAYDLLPVGRYKLNKRFGLSGKVPETIRTITKWDFVSIVAELIRQAHSKVYVNDDIDHLANRRVRLPGELIQREFRKGFRMMEIDTKKAMEFINDIRGVADNLNEAKVSSAVYKFFSTSPLCQFMDQTNPLAELRHKRTVSALGPGGLDRSRAGFDVRDIHHTHYGRICCVETPEGKNSGLISRLSVYARVNKYGLIETPYRIVKRDVPYTVETLLNRVPLEDVTSEDGDILFPAKKRITAADIERVLPKKDNRMIRVVPFVTETIIYIDAEEENDYTIALSTARLNEFNEFLEDDITSRHFPDFLVASPNDIDLLDISPQQGVGVTASCIPFLEHDDGHRALMGTNMQAQAVPLIRPEIPYVLTCMERYAPLNSSQIQTSPIKGFVIGADGNGIDIVGENNMLYHLGLMKYKRSNQATCISQTPAVENGQEVDEGDVIADTTCTEGGVLTLGHNPVIAFLSWDGGNFEDAIVLSQRLLKEDKYTSIDVDEVRVAARHTTIGVEEITKDIPGVSDKKKTHLDEMGIARIGTILDSEDIIVGKVTPKPILPDENIDPTERLLETLFGKAAAKERDTSQRMPQYIRERVIDVKVFNAEDMPNMNPEEDLIVKVKLAKLRKIEPGDKMSGRHGNKGVVSRIVPEEDMPYLEDGRPVDILLNPLGVPARMNLGQLIEVHLGWAMKELYARAEIPVFDSSTVHDVHAELARAWIFDTAWEDIIDEAWDYALKKAKHTANPFSENRGFYIRGTILETAGNTKTFVPKEESEIIDEFIEKIGGLKKGKALDLNAREKREIVSAYWLQKYGFNYSDVFCWDDVPANSPDALDIDIAAIRASVTIWFQRTKDIKPEQFNAFAEGKNFDEMDEDTLLLAASEWEKIVNIPVPCYGKQWLRDGRTGKRFGRPVTVGVMNMIKLHHLVEDKVNARSIGTYSSITQQPLGGKAKHGGQRIGEMEVWALQAYGCSYLLQEMLTIKSDDQKGRADAWSAFIRGQNAVFTGLPGSFRVLVHEMMGLGLAAYLKLDNGKALVFGKEDTEMPDVDLLPGDYLSRVARIVSGDKAE